MLMKDKMMTPALIGGLVLACGSAIPILGCFNCLCCSWLVLGGGVAAYLYIKESPEKVTMGDGAVLGAATGVAGAVIETLLSIPIKLLMRGAGIFGAERMRALLENLGIPEETRSLIESKMSAGMSVINFISHFLIMLVLCLIFATLGGIVGVAIFEKRKNGDVIFPPSPPPIPPPTPPL